ncbi:PREDICTED: tail-anchored protein insertion receptor WRB-like [Dufourea novaeangliae]|uniref:Guided entry of tail-anchored proteins factor 1 n=1 Tax=Dufourea novaeangliae TaxID=178035 RepID=A0A154PCC2_DUFNO|nr:PREDICTED: tail-anchored protein insertion receptor WRB-like [Dufourea novaeangliae]KZC09473.1 Tail-anchored protein insertion receptor WRB [Dufourea novaeangliae]
MNLLVISTVSCFLEYIVPILIKYVTSRLYTVTKYDMELRKDLMNLKQEMVGISIVDEFSRFAKLQRKCNKIEGILKETANKRLTSQMKVQLFVRYGFHLLNGLLLLVLSYIYRSTPVIVFPKGMLWPIHNLLSWPCYQEDSISLIMWIIIARLVVSACKKIDIT